MHYFREPVYAVINVNAPFKKIYLVHVQAKGVFQTVFICYLFLLRVLCDVTEMILIM